MVPLLPSGAGEGGLRGGLARAARPASGARRMTAPDLRVDLGRGLILPNPVGLASGTAGYGFELRQLIDVDRLGALFTKGTTLHPRDGNPPPRVAEVRGGMLNAIGLQNPGVEHVASAYAPEFSRWGVRSSSTSRGATSRTTSSAWIGWSGLRGWPATSSTSPAPTSPTGSTSAGIPRPPAGWSPPRAPDRTPPDGQALPNVTDIAAVARAVEEAGADSVSAVNTYVGMKIHRGIRAPVLPGRGTGGLSGPVIKTLALAAVAEVRRAVRIPVVGVGGIMDAGDALEFLIAGADAIQVAPRPS